jgi:hypothetical protein
VAGGGIGIRARLDGEQSLVLSCNHLKSPPQGGGPVSATVSRDSLSDRLRVADASVMPRIITGPTNAPTHMIAGRATKLILS